MASRVRSSSPQTEPFPPLDPTPRTPTSATSASTLPRLSSNIARDNGNLSKPQTSVNLFSASSRASLSPKSVRGISPAISPRPLTGAAAMVDARRMKQQQQQQQQQQQPQPQPQQQQQVQSQQSHDKKADSPRSTPNPAAVVLNSLMSPPGVSKAIDAPTPDHLSEPMRKAAAHLTVPVIHTGESSQPSPVSNASFGGNEYTTTAATAAAAPNSMTATANGSDRLSHMVPEPGEMTGDPQDYLDAGRAYTAPSSATSGPKAFTYPGPMSADSREMPSRGSPANQKRHKCPYCSTDFTRHHNLKSHLLTHSQEKPYVCQTCSARFRRLHDLKRHTKLHTGERPHTCEKCGRKFARGDALARHSKGPGGCAGRRSSFGADDDGNDSRAGDDGMDVDYPDVDEDDQEGEDSGEHSGRRVSEPSRKRAHVETSQDATRSVYREHSNTYPPPLASRPLRSNMGPPTNVLPSSSTVTSPGEHSNHVSPAGGNVSSQLYGAPSAPVLGQSGMTASPKPISPRQHDQHRLSIDEAAHMRNRSPSLTQQFQHHHFGRGTGQSTPPISGHVPSHAPQLPSLPGINSEQVRLGHQTRLPLAPPGPSMLQHQYPTGPTSGSNPGSLSSHGRSSGGSFRELAGGGDQELWNYVRSLEQRFSRMQDEYELRMARMQEEIITLKQHVNIQSSR